MIKLINSFFKEFCSTALYKPSQGKIARRCTFAGISLIFVLGAYIIWLDKMFGGQGPMYVIAALDVVFGVWLAFRLINFPVFADFLVSVEAEMTKVSWPSKKELFSTTKIVLVFMFLFIALIYFYDVTLTYVVAAINLVLGWIF